MVSDVEEKDKKDLNFVCGRCQGNLVIVREENGRKLYDCDECHNNKCWECTICHKPRAIWADDGYICGLCCLKYMSGELSLTAEQIKGIEKWTVTIPINKGENSSSFL